MKKLVALLGAVAFGAAAAATNAPVSPDSTLIEDHGVKVDIRDLDAFMLRVPEKLRAPFRSSYDRVASIADSLFITRVAAQKAREEGLDKDPAVQRRLQQVQEQYLAELYIAKLQKQVDAIDLDQRAKELYEADPAKYTTPEMVYVQQIMVGLNGRTPDLARQRAEKVYKEAVSGKEDFLQLAARYTDDPDARRNGGDLGYYTVSHFPTGVDKAVEKLSKKGEITAPIEGPNGFYILKFIDRKPAQLVTFDVAKDKIVSEERERLKKEKLDEFTNAVRNSKTVVVNSGNVQSYVISTGDEKSPGQAPAEPAKAAPKKQAKK